MYYRWLTILPLALVLGCGGGGSKEKSITDQYRAALKQADPVKKASDLARIAEKQNKGGAPADAQATIASAAAAAKEVKDPSSRANSLNNVGAAMARMGQEGEAKEVFSAAAVAADEIQEPDGKITPLTTLASHAGAYLKNPLLGAEYLQKAEAAAGEIKNATIRVQAYGKIAAAYSKLEKIEDAKRVADQGLEFAKGLATTREKADAISEMAVALGKMKKAEESKAAFDDAQKLAGEIEAGESQANAFLHIGKKLKEAGQKDAARTTLAKAEGLAKKVKDGSIRGPLITEIEGARKGL